MSGYRIAIDPVEITESLKGYPFLKDYDLLLFRLRTESKVAAASQWELIVTLHPEVLPVTVFAEILEIAEIASRPTVLRSHEGLYLFAVPFSNYIGQSFCIIGVGARDKGLDLVKIEGLADLMGKNPADLLELFYRFRIATKQDVEDTAAKVSEIIRSTCNDKQRAPEETLDKVNAIAGICSGIDKLTTCATTLSLFLDTLTILFDIPRLAVILTERAYQGLSLDDGWAPPAAIIKTSPYRLHNIVPKELREKSFLLGSEIAALLPGTVVDSAICLRFWSKDDDCGLVTLLDVQLTENDISLMELLNSRVAARLRQLLQEEQLLTMSTRSQKMLSVISSMLLIDDHRKLCDSLLNTAAGMVAASGGSFMILDKKSEYLQIESLLGVNPHLAKNHTIRIGEGIAGKVAAAGCPLLVTDIEKDTTIARGNRANFKTKSFISIPIRAHQKVIGVLNLSDKENGTAFNQKDMEILAFFTDHAAGIVHCALSKKADAAGENLPAIDEVTGLYSQGMLLRRMREEISRSKRQNGYLSVMLVNLSFHSSDGEVATPAEMGNTLKTVGAILKETLRENDFLSAYGEGSFCIILPDTGREASHLVAERVKTAVHRSSATNGNQREIFPVIGLSSFPKDGNTAVALINAAEKSVSYSSGFAYDPYVQLPQAFGDGSSDRLQHHQLQSNSFTLDGSRQLLPLLAR